MTRAILEYRVILAQELPETLACKVTRVILGPRATQVQVQLAIPEYRVARAIPEPKVILVLELLVIPESPVHKGTLEYRATPGQARLVTQV